MDVSRWTTSLRSALCGPEGAAGRVVLSSILAGGIFGGGLLIGGSALLGIGSVGLHLLVAPVLFVLGSLIGVVQGFALAFLGRSPSETGRQCMRRAMIGAIVSLPLLPLAWLVSSSIAVGTTLRVEMRLSWLVLSVTAALIGILVCAWAARECVHMTGRLLARLLFGLLVVAIPVPASAAPDMVQSAPVVQVADTTFRHARHSAFGCLDCHVMQPQHGSLAVRSTSDCRSCHHAPERAQSDCSACHRPVEFRNVVRIQPRALALSVYDEDVDRDLSFSHADHEARACEECHSDGPSLTPSELDCQSCHEEHHQLTNEGCWSCHQAPPDEAHTPEVHQTCAGAGCHVDAPIEAPPRTRVGCLWCHEEQAEHEPQATCVDCHFVSDPMAPAGGRPTPRPSLPTAGGFPTGDRGVSSFAEAFLRDLPFHR